MNGPRRCSSASAVSPLKLQRIGQDRAVLGDAALPVPPALSLSLASFGMMQQTKAIHERTPSPAAWRARDETKQAGRLSLVPQYHGRRRTQDPADLGPCGVRANRISSGKCFPTTARPLSLASRRGGSLTTGRRRATTRGK